MIMLPLFETQQHVAGRVLEGTKLDVFQRAGTMNVRTAVQPSHNIYAHV